MQLFINWLVRIVAIALAAYLIPGISVQGFIAAALLAVVLAAINIFIKPVVVILTLPINILTLGLFSLVINAGLVMLAAYFVPGVTVAGFWSALIFAVVLAVVSTVLEKFTKEE